MILIQILQPSFIVSRKDVYKRQAQHTHYQAAFLLLERVEELQTVQNLLLRIVADGAGVHTHCIGFLQGVGHRISRLPVSYTHLRTAGR